LSPLVIHPTERVENDVASIRTLETSLKLMRCNLALALASMVKPFYAAA
jgi:hypothetical protein